jgi:hypothetical protein
VKTKARSFHWNAVTNTEKPSVFTDLSAWRAEFCRRSQHPLGLEPEARVLLTGWSTPHDFIFHESHYSDDLEEGRGRSLEIPMMVVRVRFDKFESQILCATMSRLERLLLGGL